MKRRTIIAHTTRTAPQFCPVCFELLDASTSLDEEPHTPEPEDFTVCIGCASVLRWDDKMLLEPSSLEAIPMHSRLDFAKVVMATKARIARRGSR